MSYRSATQAVVDLVDGRIQIQFGLVGASLGTVRDGAKSASMEKWRVLTVKADIPIE